jgi:hypothetical protein
LENANIVPRPTRKNEFKIYFESPKLSKSWMDLRATQLTNIVAAWEFLTRTPLQTTSLSYPLKNMRAPIVRAGKSFERWQLKLSATDGSRIWYYVEDQSVFIEKIFTAHPNQTKK